MKPNISIVIPALNEQANIRGCLQAAAKQNYNKPFEIILVDNGSTDKTVDIASGLKIKNLHILSEPTKGRGPARKLGCDQAQGKIIVNTDSDTRLHPLALQKFEQILETKNCIAVTGTCQVEDLSPLQNWIFNTIQLSSTFIFRLIFGHFWITGANSAFLSKAYKESGGFSKHAQGIEDIDLSKKLSKLGKIAVTTKIPVITSGRRFAKNGLLGYLDYIKAYTRSVFTKELKHSNIR